MAPTGRAAPCGHPEKTVLPLFSNQVPQGHVHTFPYLRSWLGGVGGSGDSETAGTSSGVSPLSDSHRREQLEGISISHKDTRAPDGPSPPTLETGLFISSHPEGPV